MVGRSEWALAGEECIEMATLDGVLDDTVTADVCELGSRCVEVEEEEAEEAEEAGEEDDEEEVGGANAAHDPQGVVPSRQDKWALLVVEEDEEEKDKRTSVFLDGTNLVFGVQALPKYYAPTKDSHTSMSLSVLGQGKYA